MFGSGITFGRTNEAEPCGLCFHQFLLLRFVPLQSVDVVAKVAHAVAEVAVTQVFINSENNPIEAIYYFPLDSNGAVVDFEAELDGRKIKVIIKTIKGMRNHFRLSFFNKFKLNVNCVMLINIFYCLICDVIAGD